MSSHNFWLNTHYQQLDQYSTEHEVSGGNTVPDASDGAPPILTVLPLFTTSS